MYPSTGTENSFPNAEVFTLAVVSCVSFRFWPVRALSLCCVRTPAKPEFAEPPPDEPPPDEPPPDEPPPDEPPPDEPLTVRLVEPFTPPNEAWIVVVPAPTAVAKPLALTFATAVLD